MDKQRTSHVPVIVAIVLLVLPVLYLGSYLALVQPGWSPFADGCYRIRSSYLRKFFKPLERVDKRLRPSKWEPEYEDRSL